MDLCMVHCTVQMPTTDMHRSTFPGIKTISKTITLNRHFSFNMNMFIFLSTKYDVVFEYCYLGILISFTEGLGYSCLVTRCENRSVDL